MQRISSRELSEWMAYYKIEPFGEYRADLRNAILCCLIANMFSKRKSKIDDFMPKIRRSVKKMSPDVMKAMLKGFADFCNRK